MSVQSSDVPSPRSIVHSYGRSRSGRHSESFILQLEAEKELGMNIFVCGCATDIQKSAQRGTVSWNSRLLRYLVENDIRVINPRKTVAADIVVYHDATYAVSERHALLSATQTMLVLRSTDKAKLGAADLHALLEKLSERTQTFPIILGESEAVRAHFRSFGFEVNHANAFLVSSPEAPIEVRVPSYGADFVVGATYDMADATSVRKVRDLCQAWSADSRIVVSVQGNVARLIRRDRPDAGRLRGFPFVSGKLHEYLLSLHCLVITEEDTTRDGWDFVVAKALQLGIPTILPPSQEETYGSGCLYAAKSELHNLVRTLVQQDHLLREQRDASRTFAEEHASSRWRDLVGSTFPGSGTEPTCVNLDSPAQRSGSAPSQQVKPAGKIVFVTSNGAGMGHLTRLLAIARRLPGSVEATFISLSQAAPVVRQYGFDFEYIASKGDLACEPEDWNEYFERRFLDGLQRAAPAMVVFDGTWPYRGISKAMRTVPAKYVWVRRGMWRETTAPTSLLRNTDFDLVITPGESAADYDRGVTALTMDSTKVGPITVLDNSEILSREEARARLGLGNEDRVALITLGAGNINSIDNTAIEVVDSLRARHEEWTILSTSTLISHNDRGIEGVRSISVYPIAEYAMAFDFVVSATGYNSYHEWMNYSVPAIWVPNYSTITDDQVARARHAHDAGVGVAVLSSGDGPTMREAVDALCDDTTRRGMRDKLRSLREENGAQQAANLLIEALSRGKQ